jgi:hypothetical protein
MNRILRDVFCEERETALKSVFSLLALLSHPETFIGGKIELLFEQELAQCFT